MVDFPFENPQQLQAMAVQNLSAGLRMTMPNVVQNIFATSNFNNEYKPSNMFPVFAASPMDSIEVVIAAFHDAELFGLGPPLPQFFILPGTAMPNYFTVTVTVVAMSDGTGTPIDRDGIAGGGRSGSADRLAGGAVPAAGRSADNHRSQNTGSQNGDDAFPLNFPEQSEPEQPETEHPGGENGVGSVAVSLRGSTVGGGNGKGGADGSPAGSNGSRRERTGQSLGQSRTGEGNGAVEGP